MSSFRVDTSAFDSNIPKIAKIKNIMGTIQQEMSKITSRLSWEIKGQQQLDKKLTQLQSEFDTLKGSLSKMENCLVKVRDEYVHAQNDAKKELNGLSNSILGTFNIHPWGNTSAPSIEWLTSQTPATGSGLTYSGDKVVKNGGRSIPVTPKIINDGVRSSDNYNTVIDQFNVYNDERYKKHKDGYTYCNIFVWDVTSAMGAEICHWKKDGKPHSYDLNNPENNKNAYEVNANETYDWLVNNGEEYGWREVTPAEAQEAANMGKPTVASWKNPNFNPNTKKRLSGHIAVVRPYDANMIGKKDERGKDIEVSQAGVYIAQAGENNYSYQSVEVGFGKNKVKDIKYFTFG